VKIEERITGRERNQLCELVRNRLDTLRKSLEEVVIHNSASDSPSKQVKDHMLNKLLNEDWRPHFKINREVSENYPMANFTLDAIKDFSDSSCNHVHRFLVEFCFDNRQAVGTNLLKFEIASINSSLSNVEPIPVLICADSGALRYFGWDGSIASADEYEHAIRVAYKSIIKNPAIILALLK
jgi:hypothetical protein